MARLRFQAVPELNYVEAIRSALALEMERHGRVMVLGLDVGRPGGVFRATHGLLQRFGPDRAVGTLLAEGRSSGRLWAIDQQRQETLEGP